MLLSNCPVASTQQDISKEAGVYQQLVLVLNRAVRNHYFHAEPLELWLWLVSCCPSWPEGSAVLGHGLKLRGDRDKTLYMVLGWFPWLCSLRSAPHPLSNLQSDPQGSSDPQMCLAKVLPATFVTFWILLFSGQYVDLNSSEVSRVAPGCQGMCQPGHCLLDVRLHSPLQSNDTTASPKQTCSAISSF